MLQTSTRKHKHKHKHLHTQIAAASLEKLFQQLTSPQMFKEDFIEVFLMTHSCFTTSKDVLTALLNCIKSPDDAMSDTSSQTSGSVAFPFNMDGTCLCMHTHTLSHTHTHTLTLTLTLTRSHTHTLTHTEISESSLSDSPSLTTINTDSEEGGEF